MCIKMQDYDKRGSKGGEKRNERTMKIKTERKYQYEEKCEEGEE